MSYQGDGHWQWMMTADLERLYAEHVSDTGKPMPPMPCEDDRNPALCSRWDATMTAWREGRL